MFRKSLEAELHDHKPQFVHVSTPPTHRSRRDHGIRPTALVATHSLPGEFTRPNRGKNTNEFPTQLRRMTARCRRNTASVVI